MIPSRRGHVARMMPLLGVWIEDCAGDEGSVAGDKGTAPHFIRKGVRLSDPDGVLFTAGPDLGRVSPGVSATGCQSVVIGAKSHILAMVSTAISPPLTKTRPSGNGVMAWLVRAAGRVVGVTLDASYGDCTGRMRRFAPHQPSSMDATSPCLDSAS